MKRKDTIRGEVRKYSTVQYSTAQYSTAQYSTAQHKSPEYLGLLSATVLGRTAPSTRLPLLRTAVVILVNHGTWKIFKGVSE